LKIAVRSGKLGLVNVNDRLRRLVEEACKHPPGSIERQKNLTRIIRLMSGKLWRENIPEYQDVVQRMWIFFCENVCEGKTGERYNPDRSSVSTWLNYYLRRKLQSCHLDRQKQLNRTISSHKDDKNTDDREDVVARLPARPDIPPILDIVRSWAEKDAIGELRRVHLEGHPEVNCQVLILRRLPPETSWKSLAEEFNLSISTLSSFYQRQCLPRLRNFGKSEGYID
jgi:hypothetical protein